ncbi:MAG: tRNA dihydrouridine synthase DusB [Actinomycetaceae bacterium]|nr:tRNA dihydrouridine synthase DusB [Actinomycetaceae bacterium]
MGPLRLWSPVILAPMAGVTDAPFRRLCRLYGESGLPAHLRPESAALPWVPQPVFPHSTGPALVNSAPQPQRGVDAPAGLYVMEMVTSRALVEGKAKTLDMLRPDPGERVRSVQLYGVVPEVMARATQILIERDLADHVDVNFGCPVPKVTRRGGGAALPWKKDLFHDLITAVIGAAEKTGAAYGRDIPVTVKMRIGIDNDHVTCVDAAQTAQNAGAAAVALHARTQVQHYSGKARWEWIARLKDALTVPVLGNGDIFSGADAALMMEETGCDAVVIGRGCQGRPWIFSEIVSALHGGEPAKGPTLGQVVSVIEQHARWMVETKGDEAHAMREMRKHIGWYLRGFPVGGRTRHDLVRITTLDGLHDVLAGLDHSQPFPLAAEGPRGRAGGEKIPHLPEGWLDSPYLTEQQKAQLHLTEAEGIADGG